MLVQVLPVDDNGLRLRAKSALQLLSIQTPVGRIQRNESLVVPHNKQSVHLFTERFTVSCAAEVQEQSGETTKMCQAI